MQVKVGQGIIEQKPIPAQRNFGSFLSGYLDYTKNQEASQKIHLWTALSIISAALERKVWIKFQYYSIYPNTYTVIVGPPGLIKKSTATGIGVNLLKELPKMKFMSEQITDAALIDALEGSTDTFFHAGKELKQSSLFLYASELSVFFKQSHSALAELFTTFFDCSDSNKPWTRETKGGGIVSVPNPCLSMLGCTTPAWLVDTIPVDQFEGGFASRIVFVYESEKPDKFIAFPEIDPEGEKLKKRLIEDLLVINSLSGPMTITAEAKQLYAKFYEKNQMSIYNKDTDARFAGYYGRKPTHVLKIALCLSVAESNDLIITIDHMEMAINSLESLEPSMFDGLGHVGRNPIAKSVHKMQKLLQTKRHVSTENLYAAFSHDLTVEETQSALLQLQRMGYVSMGAVSGVPYVRATAKLLSLGMQSQAEPESPQHRPLDHTS